MTRHRLEPTLRLDSPRWITCESAVERRG